MIVKKEPYLIEYNVIVCFNRLYYTVCLIVDNVILYITYLSNMFLSYYKKTCHIRTDYTRVRFLIRLISIRLDIRTYSRV